MATNRRTGVAARRQHIQIQFQFQGRRCRETIRLTPTGPNLKYAERLRGEILRKIELGTFSYAEYFPRSVMARAPGGTSLTFNDRAEAWLAAADVEHSTRRFYRVMLDKHVLPTLGDKLVTQVTYSDISNLIAAIPGSAKTRNNALIPIRRVMHIAFIDGLIPSDVAARVEYQKHQSREPDPFTQDEADAIIAKIEERYGQEVANYFGFGFYSGCRTSEQIALKWEDIDWNAGESGTICISRAKVMLKEKGTKTGVVRFHELNARSVEYLRRQQQFTKLRGPYIFLDPVTGKQFNDDRQPRERYWRPILAALKMRYREPYQMRHSYATWAIMAGMRELYVAQQLGNSVEMLRRHYVRWIKAADQGRQARAMNEYLTRHTAPNSGGKTVAILGQNEAKSG
jgi:integrase